jgi:hypothetical protein
MEYGRKPDGTPDFSMNLIWAERRNTNPKDGDFISKITPDKRSHFQESGVLEADCFICHMSKYRFKNRIKQINAKNFRWAPTAGAGLGRVEGVIFKYKNMEAKPGHPEYLAGTWDFSKRPVVHYAWNDRNLFTREGKLSGSLISGTVGAKNCLQCHTGADTKKVGWINLPQFDAHYKAGLRCTDCHNLVGDTPRERLRHQIAKGWSPMGTVRDDLDGVGMKTCVSCHLEGRYRPTREGMPKEAKNPAKVHTERFPGVPFHFQMIQCSGCHATQQPGKGGLLLDMGIGKQIWYTAATLETITWAGDFGTRAPQPWRPWITRYDARNGLGAQYIPSSPMATQWFGEKMENMEIRPIRLPFVRKAFGGVKDRITKVEVNRTDGKKVKRPTIATQEDIRLMIQALTDMGFQNVVFVGDKIYELQDGKVSSYDDPFTAHCHTFPVHHNVTPLEKGLTYGAKGKPEGCVDCHSEGSTFFTKMWVRNIGRFLKEDYPVPREPNAEPQMVHWGFHEVPIPEEIHQEPFSLKPDAER